MNTGSTSMDKEYPAKESVLNDAFSRGVHSGFFHQIDIHFAWFVRRLSRDVHHHVVLAAALLSKYTREGHICLDLAVLAGEEIVLSRDPLCTVPCPVLETWTSALRACPVVGMPGDYTPLVLDEAARLYLWRYWDYEQACAEKLHFLSRQRKVFDKVLLRQGLDLVFPAGDDSETMEQKLSVLVALNSGLCVITGGPGTGKTTLVSRVLALLVQQDARLRIALAAPTGKAAQRLGEAVSKTASRLDLPEPIRAAVPEKAATIHRLLGIMPSQPWPRYNRENPLPYDVVVIDEASMVDLSLMTRLVQAIKPSARLILLGDKDQLASVQAGHVLGDLCDTGTRHGYSGRISTLAREVLECDLDSGETQGMKDSVIELTRTYRFTPDSGIHRLSRCVNQGDVNGCRDILESGGCADIRAQELPGGALFGQELERVILESPYARYLPKTDPQECLGLFNSFRVLCALREGPFGIHRMNAVIETILAAHGQINPSRQNYHGRPILITANDYTLRLFNGDVGIILTDSDDGNLQAFFPTQQGTVRKVSPVRLPRHETAFAMTVHKSQGSEFDQVLLMLPDRDAPILTRELIYTGITRAREHLDIWMAEDVFAVAVARRTQRTSGLHDLLWGHE